MQILSAGLPENIICINNKYLMKFKLSFIRLPLKEQDGVPAIMWSGKRERWRPLTKGWRQARFCGAGRTRTAVQTPHQAAFYTFSLSLVVG